MSHLSAVLVTTLGSQAQVMVFVTHRVNVQFVRSAKCRTDIYGYPLYARIMNY